MTHLSALLLWLALEYWSIRYLWMISWIMWSRSHWGGEQSCYLWEFRQKWAGRNLMKFQPSKGKVLGPGQNNCNTGEARDRVTERFAEKKLEVHGRQEVDHELALCLAEKRAGHISGCDSKSVVSRLVLVIHSNSSELVRPHLECCVHPRTTLAYSRKSSGGHQGGWHLRAQARKVSVSWVCSTFPKDEGMSV